MSTKIWMAVLSVSTLVALILGIALGGSASGETRVITPSDAEQRLNAYAYKNMIKWQYQTICAPKPMYDFSMSSALSYLDKIIFDYETGRIRPYVNPNDDLSVVLMYVVYGVEKFPSWREVVESRLAQTRKLAEERGDYSFERNLEHIQLFLPLVPQVPNHN